MKATSRPGGAGINDLTPGNLPVFIMEILGLLAVATAFVLTALDPMIGVVLLAVFAVAYATVRTLLHYTER
jgi:hypothetical protein